VQDATGWLCDQAQGEMHKLVHHCRLQPLTAEQCVCMCMYVCMYVCVYVCMCVWVCVCMCVWV